MSGMFARMTLNQLLVMKYLVGRGRGVVTQREIAKRTLITAKQLGGVLSALSRTDYEGSHIIEPMGKDEKTRTLRWRLNTKLVNPVLAERDIKALINSYK